MDENFGSRFKRAWNVFTDRDPTDAYKNVGIGYSYRPDRPRFTRGNERSLTTSVYNRIALDVASIDIKHCKFDENNRFVSDVMSGLNNCLTLSSNVDQTGRSFVQDVVMSMLDEGCVAIVPTETYNDPDVTDSYDVLSMRVGQILEWYPMHVKVRVYDERTGKKQDIRVPKRTVAIS